MTALYIECKMGAAGDMLLSALLDISTDPEKDIEDMNNLNIPNVKYELKKSEKCGIVGRHVDVTVYDKHTHEHIHEHTHDHIHEHTHDHEHNHDHTHEHSHTTVSDIEGIVKNLDLPKIVKEDVMAVYGLLAEAESHAHGKEISQIHFHEVGTMDALADIVGVCYMIYKLNPEKIMASPINLGGGTVRCAHGILPVPAPATAYILKDVPVYESDIKSELCTPTGAALLKHFADSFCDMPIMTIKKIGYGMGTKNFECANCTRAILGEIKNIENIVYEITFNVDDMTGEEIGYATEQLFKYGALEVFTTAVGMKKNRPGVLVTVICDAKKREDIIKCIFRHSTTIGVREQILSRHILDRDKSEILTPYGMMRVKHSHGYGIKKQKIEYDDIKKAADEHDMSLFDIKREIMK